jgi:hypothetical protein
MPGLVETKLLTAPLLNTLLETQSSSHPNATFSID